MIFHLLGIRFNHLDSCCCCSPGWGGQNTDSWASEVASCAYMLQEIGNSMRERGREREGVTGLPCMYCRYLCKYLCIRTKKSIYFSLYHCTYCHPAQEKQPFWAISARAPHGPWKFTIGWANFFHKSLIPEKKWMSCRRWHVLAKTLWILVANTRGQVTANILRFIKLCRERIIQLTPLPVTCAVKQAVPWHQNQLNKHRQSARWYPQSSHHIAL